MEGEPWRGRAISSPCRFWDLVVAHFFIVLIAIVVALGLHLYKSYAEWNSEALLTAPFLLPVPDAFLGTVGGAALFPLLVAVFFPGDG